MPIYPLLSCYIALAGDEDQTIYRGETNPVTLPEFMVIQRLHTPQDSFEDAATEPLVIGFSEPRSNDMEVNRLVTLYSREAVQNVWGIGLNPRLPVRDDSLVLAPGLVWPDQPVERSGATHRGSRRSQMVQEALPDMPVNTIRGPEPEPEPEPEDPANQPDLFQTDGDGSRASTLGMAGQGGVKVPGRKANNNTARDAARHATMAPLAAGEEHPV